LVGHFGRTFGGLSPNATSFVQNLAAAVQGALIHREVEIKGTTGQSIWIGFSLTPVRDTKTNLVVSVISEGRDLTEMRDLSAQLSQAQKMQALGQLAGGIAHDFNNVLQAVSGAARLIGAAGCPKTRSLYVRPYSSVV
jgi:nitrogen-specific signal transduction histidine kinase